MGSRTTLDLLLSPRTTSIYLEENSKKCPSVVEFFIQSVVTDKRTALRDARCSLGIFIQVDEPNFRTQNDFGFAIVSVDDLDLGGNSKKCPGAVEFFIQSVVTNKRITLLDLRDFIFK